jgi:hypothetical protein
MKHKSVTCHECHDTKDVRAMYALEVYDHPSDALPKTIHVCKRATWTKKNARYSWLESCEELLTDSSWADFRYFTCDLCNRMICEQAPENGWHSQVRYLGDGDVAVCLTCYQEMLLRDGIEREVFERRQLPGMFFSSVELSDWTRIVDDKHIRSKADAKDACAIAIDYIDRGYKVLVDYERMAIGGLEGYVSLYAKQKDGSDD